MRNRKLVDWTRGALIRVWGLATLFSGACCVLLMILLPISFFLQLPEPGRNGYVDPNGSISIGDFHIAAAGGAFWLFNDELPYCGSIIGIDGRWDGVRVAKRLDWGWSGDEYGLDQYSYIDFTGSCAGKVRYGDFPGIYYRHFEWRSSNHPYWTLAMHLAYPIALTAILPSLWLIRRFGPKLRFSLKKLLVALTVVALALAIAV